MSVTPYPVYPQSLLSVPTQFTDSTSTSVPTQILAAQTNGAKIEAILVASTDPDPKFINIYLNVSTTNYLIATVNVPGAAGDVDTVPTVNVLTALYNGATLFALPTDANGNPYLYLDSNTALYAAPESTISSDDVWNIVVMGGAF